MARIKHVLHVKGADPQGAFSSIDFTALSDPRFSHHKIGSFREGVSLPQIAGAAAHLAERGRTMVMVHAHGRESDGKHFIDLVQRNPTPTAQIFSALAAGTGGEPIDVFLNSCFSNYAQADRDLLPDGSVVMTRSGTVVRSNYAPYPACVELDSSAASGFSPIFKRRKDKNAPAHPKAKEMVVSSLNDLPETEKVTAANIMISYILSTSHIQRASRDNNNHPIFGISRGQQIDVSAELQRRRCKTLSSQEWRLAAERLAGHLKLDKKEGVNAHIAMLAEAWETPEENVVDHREGVPLAIAFAVVHESEPFRSATKPKAKRLNRGL